MTFSARLNDDGSWRGLVWGKEEHPLIIVGINQEYFWTRKEAIRAAKAKAEELNFTHHMTLNTTNPMPHENKPVRSSDPPIRRQ